MLRISKILSKVCRKKEGGFVLLELMVAIVITGIIVTGISTVVLQVVAVKALSANMLTAVNQVENAFHYLIRDVQMCQNATEEPEGLVLQWNWPDGYAPYHRVAYEIDEDTGELYRSHTTHETWNGPTIEEAQILVAQFIDTELLDWEVSVDEESGVQTVKMTIVASVGGYKTSSETRIIDVTPRLTP